MGSILVPDDRDSMCFHMSDSIKNQIPASG